MLLMIFMGIMLAVFVFFVGIYNTLVRQKNQVANALSQIDVQLKRRYDLIPNLVEVAKRYMSHESKTLVAVTWARNQAKKVNDNANLQAFLQAFDMQDNASGIQYQDVINKIISAENSLSQALGQFYAVSENYPELKADKMMSEVMDELKNSENRISFARQHYNDSVMSYNNSAESFPNNLISGFFGFYKLSPLSFADKSVIDMVPVVSF